MLSLEKSGLGHPGHEGRMLGRCCKAGPLTMASLPGSASPTRLFLDLKLFPAASVSLARAEMLGSSSPQGAGVLFLTLGCSQQKERDCPDAHHLQYIQMLPASSSGARAMSRLRDARLFARPLLHRSWENGKGDLPCRRSRLPLPLDPVPRPAFIPQLYRLDATSRKQQVMIKHAVCT